MIRIVSLASHRNRSFDSNLDYNAYAILLQLLKIISIINHTLPSTIRAVISTLACTSMVSNSTRDSECYLAVPVQVRVLLLP